MVGNGQRPPWNYGCWTSFGVWTHPVSSGSILILLYSGVVLDRKHDFDFKVVPVGGEESEEGVQEFEVDVKERITPKLTNVGPCGGTFSKGDFPLYFFVSGSSVVCSKDGKTAWRVMSPITKDSFYTTVAGNAPSGFDLPELSKDVYDTEKDKEETQAALLYPIWRLDVEETSLGELYLSEILDIHALDTYRFNPKDDEDEDEDDKGDEDDPCEPKDAVEGGVSTGDGGGVGGGGPSGEGVGGGDRGEAGVDC